MWLGECRLVGGDVEGGFWESREKSVCQPKTDQMESEVGRSCV